MHLLDVMQESSVTWKRYFVYSIYNLAYLACIVHLPVADGFLENRSIRTQKYLQYSLQIMLTPQS